MENNELIELIEKAETPLEKPDTKNKSIFNEATRFVIANDIEAGTKKVSAVAVWYLYTQWKDSINEAITLKDITFYKQLAKMFTRKKVGGNVFYMLETNGLTVADEMIDEMKRKKMYEKYEQTKKKNREEKIKKAKEKENEESK